MVIKNEYMYYYLRLQRYYTARDKKNQVNIFNINIKSQKYKTACIIYLQYVILCKTILVLS